jgi:hypothetical protein
MTGVTWASRSPTTADNHTGLADVGGHDSDDHEDFASWSNSGVSARHKESGLRRPGRRKIWALITRESGVFNCTLVYIFGTKPSIQV